MVTWCSLPRRDIFGRRMHIAQYQWYFAHIVRMLLRAITSVWALVRYSEAVLFVCLFVCLGSVHVSCTWKASLHSAQGAAPSSGCVFRRPTRRRLRLGTARSNQMLESNVFLDLPSVEKDGVIWMLPIVTAILCTFSVMRR